MAEHFDNQYFKDSAKFKPKALDNNTDFAVHSRDFKDVYKTLLFSMRNHAKKFKTIKETANAVKPRVNFCGYVPEKSNDIGVYIAKSTKDKFSFHGVSQCANYWRCPVCAFKIAEAKKEFISELITAHQKQNKRIGFLTLTIRHNKKDTLNKSLNKLLDNYRAFHDSQKIRKLKKSISFLGQVKTLEITYSQENGWHPHLHILFFYNTDGNQMDKRIQLFQNKIIDSWCKYRTNFGSRSAQNSQILTRDISDYLAKYDMSSEMTKGQIKSSKGLTPFTALAKLVLQDFENEQEKRLLWGVYCNFAEQTQGKHFVNISRSLRKLYPEVFKKEKTDEQIVKDTDIDEILAKISLPVWKIITKKNLQPILLQKIKLHGIEAVKTLLDMYKNIQIEIDYKPKIPLIYERK